MTMKLPIAIVSAIVSLVSVCAGEVVIQQGSNVAPNGDRIEVTSKCLRLNGKAIIPLMGEMHYSRVPRGEWAASLKTMKDGGGITRFCFSFPLSIVKWRREGLFISPVVLP